LLKKNFYNYFIINVLSFEPPKERTKEKLDALEAHPALRARQRAHVLCALKFDFH